MAAHDAFDPRVRKLFDSSNSCWMYAETRAAGNRHGVIKLSKDLTPGELEQLTEYHVRRARRSLMRFDFTGSKRTAKTAAEHVLRARYYRGLYRLKLNLEPDERDMPFPMGTEQEAAAMTAETDE